MQTNKEDWEVELEKQFPFMDSEDFAWDSVIYGNRKSGLTKTKEIKDFISQLLSTQEEKIVCKLKEAIQKDIDFATKNNQMYSAEAYKLILIMESNKD